MLKTLNIDNFYDGYKTSDLNCVDLPMAAASGHFNRDNYFFYCFSYSYLLNFHCNFEDDWFSVRSKLLRLLGLELYKVSVEGEEELYEKVAGCIAKEHPVVFLVKYGALFYSKYYKWGAYNHGLIVSDFNDELRTFGVRDREVVREHIQAGIFHSDVMHRLQIDYEQLYQIWKASNLLFQEEGSVHHKLFYAMRPVKEGPAPGFLELLQEILDESKWPAVNQFERYVWELQERTQKGNPITGQEDETYRRVYQRSFLTFFDVVKKYLFSENLEDKGFLTFSSKFQGFLDFRLKVLNKLHISSLRGMTLPSSELKADIEKDYGLFLELKACLLKGGKHGAD